MDEEDELILNAICKVSPISIEVIDIKSNELVCTNGWTSKHLGYSEEEFNELSRNLFEKIVHPDDRNIQLGAFQCLYSKPETPFKEFTIRVLRKDGDYDYILIRLTVLELDESKNPKTILSMISDVNEVVTLRESLDKQLKKLDIISYKNSHELRGPVATILGLIQLIDHDHFDGAHAKEIILCLKKAVIKLDKVIHEINENSY